MLSKQQLKTKNAQINNKQLRFYISHTYTLIMKITTRVLLLFYIINMLVIIIHWISIYLPQTFQGVADGSAGLGRNIASAFFGGFSLIVIVCGMWCLYLIMKPQFISIVQIIILSIILFICSLVNFFFLNFTCYTIEQYCKLD